MQNFVVDSNVPFIATGQIGEAWAVVILEEIAKGRLSACTTVLFAQEVLDVFYQADENYKGRKIYNAFCQILPSPLSATVEDFDRCYELHQKFTNIHPRELMSAAIMERAKIKDIFSLDGPDYSGLDFINVIRLPTFLQKLGIDGDYVYERFRNKQ